MERFPNTLRWVMQFQPGMGKWQLSSTLSVNSLYMFNIQPITQQFPGSITSLCSTIVLLKIATDVTLRNMFRLTDNHHQVHIFTPAHASNCTYPCKYISWFYIVTPRNRESNKTDKMINSKTRWNCIKIFMYESIVYCNVASFVVWYCWYCVLVQCFNCF
jgi:hypothetical protein